MNIIAQVVNKYIRLAAPPKRGTPEHKETSFVKSIEGKKFKSPKSGRMVKFTSLPPEEQKKIRSTHSRHYKASDGVHPVTKKLFDGWHGKNQGKVTTKTTDQSHPVTGKWASGDLGSKFKTGNGTYYIGRAGHVSYLPKGAKPSEKVQLGQAHNSDHAKKIAGAHHDKISKVTTTEKLAENHPGKGWSENDGRPGTLKTYSRSEKHGKYTYDPKSKQVSYRPKITKFYGGSRSFHAPNAASAAKIAQQHHRAEKLQKKPVERVHPVAGTWKSRPRN